MNQALKWKLIAGFILVFLAGGVLGGYFAAASIRHHFATGPHHGIAAERMKEHLRNQLQLTPEQLARISPIVDKAGADLEQIRRETGQRVHRIMADTHKDIAPLLTDEQREKFRRMEERQRQWHEGMRRRPPPPPGGRGSNEPPPPPEQNPETQ